MISTWETVAKKVAEKLGIEESLVKEHILEIARNTIKHLENPDVLEYEVFGIFYLVASHPKINKSIKKVQNYKQTLDLLLPSLHKGDRKEAMEKVQARNLELISCADHLKKEIAVMRFHSRAVADNGPNPKRLKKYIVPKPVHKKYEKSKKAE